MTQHDSGPIGDGAEQATPLLFVGVGASAGGLDALEKLLTHAPPKSGFAYVVVSHLEHHQGNILPEILARRTSMPVREAEDGARVSPDQVWVIPPGAVLRIENGALRLETNTATGRARPIDTFFRSLAQDRGERAVGIVLSGNGDDGTMGLRSIREHAGLTLAQAPETAKESAMPESAILAGFVDEILPVEEIPARLTAHFQALSGRSRNDTELDEDVRVFLREICEILKTSTGHDFALYKEGTLVRRVRRRIQVTRAASAGAYVRRLDEDRLEPALLLRDLLIGVTQFFRDPDAFEGLAEKVLRSAFDQPDPRPLRIWVPGCATGEEAYSLAILVRERLLNAWSSRTVQIFATDIDADALQTARAARYREDIAEHVSEDRLRRFFNRDEAGYQVIKEVRDMCVFSVHNLIRDPPFSQLDLVSCRNLLIYFDADLQKRVIPLFHYALRRPGFLFLGPSEDLAGHADLFVPLDKHQRIFQRKDTVAHLAVEFPLSRRRNPSRAPGAAAPDTATRNTKQSVLQAFERMLLDDYTPASAVIDDRGDILCVAGGFGRFFAPRTGVFTSNLLDYTEGTFRHELRRALSEAAAKGQAEVPRVAVSVSGVVRHLRVTVRPAPGTPLHSGLHAVVLEELPPPDATGKYELPAPEIMIEQLEDELKTTRADLQAAVEELETLNEDLKSSNEELMSTNEELQSANEELQTSKEDLQAVNDELANVNAALKEKVRELGVANSDLQNLFASTQVATIFLSRDLRLTKFTPSATSLFNFIEPDVGRPLADLVPRFEGTDLLADVREVLRTLSPLEKEVRAADAELIVRTMPYRAIDNTIAGAVVTFVDVTRLKRAEAEVRALNERTRIILESIDNAFYSLDDGWRFTYVNQKASELWGKSREGLLGRNVWEVFPKARNTVSYGKLHEAMAERRAFAYEVYAESLGQWVSVNLYPTERGLSVFLQDITERKRAEQTLQEDDRRKTQFLGMLSHELRNPLASIQTSLHVMDNAPLGSAPERRARAVIGRQVGQLSHLVDDLLDLTRITQDKIDLIRRRLDLREIVRRTVEDYQQLFEDAGIAVDLDLPDAPVIVNADATRLAQVIGNLLQNAAKFSDRGSRVGLALASDPSSMRATIRVADSGMGMTSETLERLFQPFMQADRTLDRKNSGLGLGLSLVKRLAELHGGAVSARSDGLGRGSAFTVTLPLEEAPLSEPAHRAAVAAPRAHRVLLIEDNVDVADTMRDALELERHEVLTADTGAAGLALAREHRPDVVICDIGLPGMNGYEVARALRADEALKGVFLIAITGYARPDDVREAMDAGFHEHMAKPVSLRSLADLLNSIVREKPR